MEADDEADTTAPSDSPASAEIQPSKKNQPKQWKVLEQNTFLAVQCAKPAEMAMLACAVCKDNQSAPSSIGFDVKDAETKDLRTMLGSLKSFFPPGSAICECPFVKQGECCGKRHCEPFWRSIMKLETRANDQCSGDCGFCHDPRHFPDEEWVKLRISRAPAARRRQKCRTGKKLR